MQITKVEAIKKVMQDNGGIANWRILYNELSKYYPNIKNSIDWKAGVRGVLYREINHKKNFKKIGDGLFSLIDYNEDNLLIENNDKIISTEKKSIIMTRIKQDELRSIALKELKFCPFTKINDKRLLITSHIKPWAFSNNKERLDINNVFLFSPLYDKLFDKGLISFTNDKRLLISKDLSLKNQINIGIIENQVIDLLPIFGREKYLEYHRNNVFLG